MNGRYLMKLYREDLDNLGCSTPNCDHDHSEIYLHGRCHPHSRKQEVRYVKSTGTIEVSCGVCRKHIASVPVASVVQPEPAKADPNAQLM